MKIIFNILCICLFLVGSISAQPGTISEGELSIQAKFLEAKQKKLLGYYEESIKLFKDVLKKDPKNDPAHYELARIYLSQEKSDKALSAIQDAINIDGKNVWYYSLNADILLEGGQYLNAALSYENLMKLQPQVESHYVNLAFCYMRAEEGMKAVKTLDQMETQFGVNEVSTRKKFEIYDRLGKENKAVEEVEKLIKIYPSEIAYYHILATYYKKIRKEDKAKEVYADILKLDPNDSKANIAMAGDFRKEGKDITYLNSIRSILNNPDIELDLKIQELIPYVEKIAARQNLPLSEAVLESIEVLDKVHPQEAKIFAMKADILNYSNQREKALATYKQSLALNETVFAVWEQAMYIQAELNDMEGLLKMSENAMDVFPNRPLNYYMNGLANASQKKYNESLLMLEQAMLMMGKNTGLKLETLSLLGNVYHELNRSKESNEAFEKALSISPEAITVVHNYSYLLAKRGEDLEKAKSMIVMANKKNPDHPKIQHAYAWVLYKMKDLEGAKKWLSKSLANGGDKNPNFLEHYGDILFELKNKEQALEYWQRAKELGSKSEILEKKISDKQLYPYN